MKERPNAPASPWVRLQPWLIFLLAFCLRTAGLSHDLDRGNEYHPDTLKQMVATRIFLEGRYYYHVGNPDYDGYPYFNSHLVEYLVRGYAVLRRGLLLHIGAAVPPLDPTKIQLLWVTRWLNAFLSALSAVVVFAAGRRFFNRRVAWVAGLLLALSPVDISTCHVATGDSTAAFFAAVALYFAIAVYRRASWTDYLWGALFSAAAFSAKYHGGIALLPIVFAHGLRHIESRQLLSLRSIARLALLGVALVGGVLLTTPGLLVAPEKAFGDLLDFLRYTSNFGLPEELRAMSLPRRFAWNLDRNLPTFYNFLGPVVCAAGIAALFTGLRKKETWVAALAPVVYLLVGLTFKPKSPPLYITLVTPALFLAGEAALVTVTNWKRARAFGFLLLAALTLWALAYFAEYTRRDLFFYRHADTRRIAAAWAHDNIPTSVALVAGAYTFDEEPWPQPRDPHDGEVVVYSAAYIHRPPGMFPLARMDVENNSEMVFEYGRLGNLTDYMRNREIAFFLGGTDRIRSNFCPAVFLPLPAGQPVDLVLTDPVSFYRNQRVIEPRTGDRIGKVLVSAAPLADVLLVLRNGALPSSLDVHIGDTRHELWLAAGETRVVRADSFLPLRPLSEKHTLYDLRLRQRYGYTRVWIATDEVEKGFALYQAGEFERAFQQFDALPESRRNLNVNTVREISGLLSGRLTNEVDVRGASTAATLPDLTPAEFLDAFGVSVDFLDELPYLSFAEPDLAAEGMQPVPEPESAAQFALVSAPDAPTNSATTPVFFLEPGTYRLTLRVRDRGSPWRLDVTDARGTPYSSTNLVLGSGPGREFETVTLPLEVSRDMTDLRIRLTAEGASGLALDRIRIQPDPLRWINSQRRLLNAMRRGKLAPEGWTALDYEPLLLTGDVVRDRGYPDRAVTFYLAARRACPLRIEAYDRLAGIPPPSRGDLDAEVESVLAAYEASADLRESREAVAEFENGVQLKTFRLGGRGLKPGARLAMGLYWDTPDLRRRLGELAVWSHLVDPKSGAEFPLEDHALVQDLMWSRFAARFPPVLHDKGIPAAIPPGTYRLEIGLWRPAEGVNVRLRSSDLPHDKNGVFIADVTIEDGGLD